MSLRSGRLPAILAAAMLAFILLGCSINDLFSQQDPTPEPTRALAPTFTSTPNSVQALIVITPPQQGTPGVIIVPPGTDPSSLIPLPAAGTPDATPADLQQDGAVDSPSAQVTIIPLPTRPTPTNTPQPVAPTVEAIPSPIIVPPPTSAPPPSPLVIPTSTATPFPTDTSTPTATPYVLVSSGLVNLRSGPGIDYPLIAQLGPDIAVAIVGQNSEGTWYQICCVNGDAVWVAKNHVQALNSTSGVSLILADSPPTPTATGTPTETPTITPTPTATPYPFQIVEGPLFFPTGNELLTIWTKIGANSGGGLAPLPGYFLRVLFRNRDDQSTFDSRPNTKGEQPSADYFEFNVPPGSGSGNRVDYNYKFEFMPPDPQAEDPNTTDTRATVIDGYWRIYVVDGAGNQLSNAIEFDTLSGNKNREVYVAWGKNP